MSEIITISPEQLQGIVDQSITATLTALGIKARNIEPWMSKHQASKLIGRKRVESAMNQGRIVFRKTGSKKQSRVLLSRKDVEKILRQPII